jgi:predicted TIM-barrel fold metal-dependent hydrolase
MHPDFADPAPEIARMSALGLRCFKMHPEYQQFEPTEPRMRAIYAAAAEHSMILFFHAGADVAYSTVRGTPEQFCTVLDEWPELTAVLAHMGGFRQWHEVSRQLTGRDVWLDTAYTLGHLPDDEFVALAREHGCDRVLFGTDGPWTDAAAQIAHLRRLPFTGEELAAILGGNAIRLLEIPNAVS